MKKLLLASVAISGLAFASAPAYADIDLELGGYFKGYGVYVDQDEDAAAVPALNGEARNFDILRDTELHFGGETTLDNGLTVGAHAEFKVDGDDGSAMADESYAYFSGNWGRVNVGNEDGAAYLLQVAAPSADSNIDGIRQYIQPVNYQVAVNGTTNALDTAIVANGIDYEQNATAKVDKLTYLSPIMNGFQLGLSYTPDVAGTTRAAADLTGVGFDDDNDVFGAAYEAGVRYEGTFQNVGVIVGGGYTLVDQEANTNTASTISDDRTVWNIGLDLDIGPFGIGAVYTEDDYGNVRNAANTGDLDDEETFVIGVDYTTGPFKLGASYLDQDGTLNVVGNTGNDGVETQRYTGGVVYTYGPGMTFRGSVSYIEHDNVAGLTTGDEIDATAVMLGTQVNF